jgi:uncharacterized FlaG/YvyC family protein
MSSTSSIAEMSEDTDQALIEAMATQKDDLQDKVKRLNEPTDKLNTNIRTFQSIVKSDLIGKIFKCL